MDCIFCKIIAGEIPSIKVFEDEHTLSFMDINPLSEGHLLIVPKKHFVDLFEADEGALGHVMATAHRVAVAMRTALAIDSLNIVQANGRWAVQSVPHFHLHLIPRRENDGLGLDWGLEPGDVAAVRAAGEAISKALP